MKKILIAIVLLVVAVVAAGPFLIGSQAETITKNLVEKSNTQLALYVQSSPKFKSASVTVDSYEKGYLNATASGVLKLVLVGIGESKEVTVPYTNEVTHGPYLGGAGFGLARVITRPDLSGLDLPEAINKDSVILESIVGFAQDLKQTLTVAPINFQDENGTKVDFAGATLNNQSHLKDRLTFAGDISVAQLKLSSADRPNIFMLKPFVMEVSGQGEDKGTLAGSYQLDSGVIEASLGEDVNVTLQKLDMSGDFQKANGADFLLGDSAFNLKDLVITNPLLPDPLKVPELSFETNIEQASNEDLTISMKYQGALDPSIMKVMNSPVDVKTAEIDLQFKSIPLSVVTGYQQMIQKMEAGGDDPQKAAEAMQAKLFELVQMLAQNAASTHLKVNASSAEGDLVADINTGFKPGVDFDAAQMMQILAAPNPGAIMPLLVGRGNVSLGRGVTDKAGLTPMIQIMAAEFVTLKDDKFVSELQITDGQLLINGSPLPLAPQ